MTENNRKRIIFIDLMRAFAVFMMVQGHTIDSFLSAEFKSPDSGIFAVWNYIRGFTAPIFMFSAGVAFTYLLRLEGNSFSNNPRVKKGFIRFITLLVIAYLLRYPTYKIFDFSEVTIAGWTSFFTVDTLHLIAFGLLFIIIFVYLSEKLNIKDIYLFIGGAALFLIAQIFAEPVRWTDFLHPFFANYLYSAGGSFFPLFPWVGYLLIGAALGTTIAGNPDIFRDPKFGIKLIVAALLVFGFGKTLEQVKFALNWGEPLWVNATYWFTLRVGVVLGLNGVMCLLAHRLNNIPKVVKLFGRYSLVIYVVHIIMLYGDTWFPGFNELYYQHFGIGATLVLTLIMLSLMGGMVLMLDYIKNRKKQKKVIAQSANLNIELSEK